MVQIMTLVHFQRAGQKPIALVVVLQEWWAIHQVRALSATTDLETLQHNLDCQKKQLEKFLDFDCGANSAEIVNNYDWFKEFDF